MTQQQPHILTQDGTCPHGCDYAKDGDRYIPHRYPEVRVSRTEVGPHDFQRISWLHRRKCRACYWPKNAHPTGGWTTARPIGDTSGFVRAPLADTSPALIEQLQQLGSQYGPLGVALAAARLTDRDVLVRRLTADPADVPITRTIPRP